MPPDLMVESGDLENLRAGTHLLESRFILYRTHGMVGQPFVRAAPQGAAFLHAILSRPSLRNDLVAPSLPYWVQ